MNYLLFTYYDETVIEDLKKTKEIAIAISENISTGNVKYFYGKKYAIFHFRSKNPILDISDILNFIQEEISGYDYFLTKKPREIVSNFNEETLDDFAFFKSDKSKGKINFIKLESMFDDSVFNISDFLNINNKQVCNMSLDDLLDKISEKGINSLTDLEKEKLNNYSQSIKN